MPTRKLPRDPNELARYILDVTIGDEEKIEPAKKNAAAVALGKLGASKGGKARAEKLSTKKRQAIAKKAAKARWKRS